MSGTDQSKDIVDLNLQYLMVAVNLLRKDKVGAMLQLGMQERLADMLLGCSMPQLVKLATSNFVLCGPRFDEVPIDRVLCEAKNDFLSQTHLSIVRASGHRTKHAVARAERLAA